MPDGLSVTALTMKEKVISITVTSSSLSSLDSFTNNLVSLMSENKNFSLVKLVSLSDTGTDVFSLTVNLVVL